MYERIEKSYHTQWGFIHLHTVAVDYLQVDVYVINTFLTSLASGQATSIIKLLTGPKLVFCVMHFFGLFLVCNFSP